MEYEIGTNESVSRAIVPMSAVDGREPSSLPPLTRVLDPEALDTLFDVQPDGEPRIGGRLSFIYDHCRVTVDNGEYLTIQILGTYPRTSGDRRSGCTNLH